jgi:hypothetical protein
MRFNILYSLEKFSFQSKVIGRKYLALPFKWCTLYRLTLYRAVRSREHKITMIVSNVIAGSSGLKRSVKYSRVVHL